MSEHEQTPTLMQLYLKAVFRDSPTLHPDVLAINCPGLAGAMQEVRKYDPAYTDLAHFPWAKETWWVSNPEMRARLPHPAEDNPAQVAYCKTGANLLRILPDAHPTRAGEHEPLYTRTTPGSFLALFFNETLTPQQIKDWTNAYTTRAALINFEIRTLDNASYAPAEAEALQDAWFNLYRDVLVDYSCMRGSEGVRAYGLPGNGLGLAYCETEDGTRFMRTILYRGDPTQPWNFSRVFPYTGDANLPKFSEEQGIKLFESQGWAYRQDLDGYSLARVEHKYGGYCMPYIDGYAQNVDERGDHFVITRHGDYDATNTSGKLVESTPCDVCGDEHDEGDLTYVESAERYVCGDCLISEFTLAYGRRYQEYYYNSDCIYNESDDAYYNTEWLDEHGIECCVVTGNYFNETDLVQTSAGLVWSEFYRLRELDVPDPDGNKYALEEDATTETNAKGETRVFHVDSTADIAEFLNEETA